MGGFGPCGSSERAREQNTRKADTKQTLDSIEGLHGLLDTKKLSELVSALQEISNTYARLEALVSNLPVDIAAGGGVLKLIPELARRKEEFEKEHERAKRILERSKR